tara:strand:- start:9900 stop:12965 length:3066 start_codon:yes stop_codon:yes gene_type:complete
MLSVNFIKLSLQGYFNGDVKYYQKILAITFTNKAASEMKDRIIYYLRCLSLGKDIDNVLDSITKDSIYQNQSVFDAAKEIYSHIIHHYNKLSISTIDKFTTHLVRSFSKDLGLSYNFDLELDKSKIMEPVIALMLSEVSNKGDDLSELLVGFVMSKVDEGKSSDIEVDLNDFSSELFKEGVYDYFNKNKLSIKDYINVKNNLLKKTKELEYDIKQLKNQVCLYFSLNNLTKDHFTRGTFYDLFAKKLNSKNYEKWMPSKTLQNNIENGFWCSKNANQIIKSQVSLCVNELNNFYQHLIVLLKDFFSYRQVLKNIYPLSVLLELNFRKEKYKKDNNIEQLFDFNKKINEIISSESSAFIYERIGERYQHYLIDEFQDTSIMQWQNLLPLLVDSLDYGKSYIVGDGKQSIYRWRGGEAEQFLQLPAIYKSQNLIFKSEWEGKLNQHYHSNILDFNYRSREEIVKFNNLFFEKTKYLLSKDLQDMYKNHHQKVVKKSGGFVHIELFDGDKQDYREKILKKIVDIIKDLVIERKSHYKDFTILCNTSKRVSLVANHLLEMDIPVVSSEGLLLSSSSKVNFLICVLEYLNDPYNFVARAAIVSYLSKNKLISTELHLLNLQLKDINEFRNILEKSRIIINEVKLLKFSFYEMIEQLMLDLKIKTDVYVDFFLDFVFEYSKNIDCNLPSFLRYWDERKQKEAIVIPEGINAVQIMTIHKSKGLAFKNVIIPFNWQDTKNKNDIWVDSANYFNGLLPSSLIKSSSKLENTFFANDFKKDYNLRLLDNLNKLYVATTRAKDRLYIFSKSFSKNIKNDYRYKGNLNSFLFDYDDNYPLFMGEDIITENKQNISHDLFKVKENHKLNWREIISIKHSASEIFDIDQSKNKKDQGKLLHKILADIHYLEDKKQVIESYCSLSEYKKQDFNEIKSIINKFFLSEDILRYFEHNWVVRTEKEILMPDGKTYIPDRLLFHKKSDEVVVIDYKTGKVKKEHESQILNYAKALSNMGYNNIKKVLIYVNKDKMIKEL